MSSSLILGIVGDDFTGSSDAASFVVKAGLKTMLFDGIPQDFDLSASGVQAAVIALKSRMAPVQEAKDKSLAAALWLKEHGARHIFSKYCSTFDSTPQGNIGPILDNMLQHFHERSSILCPALPVNGRIVRDGILYINGVPLAESPMKNHPLTPMWDSSLKNLMEAQSEYTCFDVPHETLYDDIELENLLEDLNERYDHYYLIPDYKDEHDAARIAQKFGDLQVLSGGSGILTELGRYYVRKYHEETAGEVMPPSGTAGRALVLAGSCSVATLGQIKTFAQEGNVTMQINPHELMQGTLKARDLWEQYKAQTRPALIYSSDSADKVQALQQRYGKDELAAAIENLMTELTRLAYADGFTRFIVAGGETSGAVMKGLPADGYLIDASVAPGVPVMVPSKHPAIRLVLKSGNFGDSRFFSKALQMTADK